MADDAQPLTSFHVTRLQDNKGLRFDLITGPLPGPPWGRSMCILSLIQQARLSEFREIKNTMKHLMRLAAGTEEQRQPPTMMSFVARIAQEEGTT